LGISGQLSISSVIPSLSLSPAGTVVVVVGTEVVVVVGAVVVVVDTEVVVVGTVLVVVGSEVVVLVILHSAWAWHPRQTVPAIL